MGAVGGALRGGGDARKGDTNRFLVNGSHRQFGFQSALDRGELLGRDADFIKHLDDVLAPDLLEVLFARGCANSAELDGCGADQQFVGTFLEVKRWTMTGAGKDQDSPGR